MAPGGAVAEVDDDDPVRAFRGGVGDVGYAAARGGQGGPETEAPVVEAGVREGDGFGEEDGGEDGFIRVRLMLTSLGPPKAEVGRVPLGRAVRPVSRIQRRSAGSITTLCTPMWCLGSPTAGLGG
jgi:hypothetical protein